MRVLCDTAWYHGGKGLSVDFSSSEKPILPHFTRITMAYVEVWKSGRLVARRCVDEQKAKTGCRIRLGATGEVRVAIGQSEKLGEFEVRMFEGEPPPVPETLKRTVSVSDDQNAPSLAGKTGEYPDIEGYKIIDASAKAVWE